MTTVNLYPEAIFDPPPSEFSDETEDACKEIHKACKGFGVDKGKVIKALASKPPEERMNIFYCFKDMYDKSLQDVLKSECGSGDLGLALQLLSLPMDEADAKVIRKANQGIGTSEHLLYPVLCGRSNKEIAKLKEAYFSHYDSDLSVTLSKELGGDFERFIFHCLQGAEDEYDPDGFHDADKVEADVDAIYEAGEGRWGTDEKGIFKIIAKSPPEHLEAVNNFYLAKYDKSLNTVMDSELGGHVEKAVMYAIGMKLTPYKTVAALIKKACAGFGTDETALTCAIIRYQSIMPQVNDAHIELYGKTIHDRVKSETGGKYREVLVEVLDTVL